MRKNFFLLFVFSMMGLGLHAQDMNKVKILEELTSKLTNVDFSADEPIMQLIRTYDYDMADDGVGAGGTEMFGQQSVSGWTAERPSDNVKVMQSASDPQREDGANARAGGIFSLITYDDDPEAGGRLGGAYYPPYVESDTEGWGITGPVLGMVAVWGADIRYTQPITLPAGDYLLVVTLQNTAGSNAALNSLMGFVAEDGTAQMSKNLNYPVGEWMRDSVVFRLTEQTAGNISLGYKSGNYGSGGAPHIFLENVKLYRIDTNVIDQVAIDEAKEKLLALIEEGIAHDVDTSAAQSVYDDPNATLEQVLKAIEDQKAMNEAAVTDLSEFFINNPHFSQDDPIEDGITTYDYDMPDPNGANGKKVTHYGMQPVTGWVSSTPSDNIQHMANSGDSGNDAGMNARASGVFALGSEAFLGGGAFLPPSSLSDGTEGRLLGFISVWSAMSQYKQQTSRPAGKFTIEVSYYNVGGGGAVSKNLMGFVEDNGTEHLGTTTTFAAGKWLKESIEFELDEVTSGYFTMGYTAANQGSGSMPHLFIDGFALYYVGTGLNASLLGLQAAVTSAENVLDKPFNADLKSQLESAIEAGQELVNVYSDDEEANRAAMNAITDLMAQVNQSIAAYDKLQKFYDNELLPAVEKYDKDSYPELADALSTMNDGVQDALGDCNWTNEQIDEAIASLKQTIKDEIQRLWDEALASGEKLEKDLDISPLFDQLAYTFSTTAVSNTSVPDKEWKYGSANNFKTQYGTAEVWNQSPFEVSRTLANMPAGKYTITTKAFYRTADNETNFVNWSEESEPQAYVFAGSVKTGLTNVAAIASHDPDEFKNAAKVVEEFYVPNNQETAYLTFTNPQYTDALEKSASTVLVSEGDLTFGIKADQMEGNSWVVWYTFSVAYNALDNDGLDAEILALIDEADAMREGGEVVIEKAIDELANASDNGNDAVISGDKDAKVAAINMLKDAIAYAEAGFSLMDKLNSERDYYTSLFDKYIYDSNNTELSDQLDNIEEALVSNEAIEETIAGLPGLWVKYVLGQDFSVATAEFPVDVTGIILNADFEVGNSNFWTITAAVDTLEDGTKDRVGQNQGYQSNTTYTNEDITISKFIEAWRPNGEALHDGTLAQTLLAALPEGYYTFEADAFATNQTEIPEGGITGAYMMVTDGTSTWKEPVGIEVNSGVPQHFTLDFYSDGKTPVTVGLLVAATNASWIVADNFQLSYIGTTVPDGIEAIENAQSSILNGKSIYNLAGQRVQKPVKGLYIINGKKVVVK